MAHIRTWLLAVALAFGHIAQAPAGVPETPRLRVMGVEDGLPSSNVNALAFDRAGYLWIGTADGLARYDGVDLQVWRHDPRDSASLPGNHVAALHVDAADRIWVATEGRGLSVLDAGRQRFHHYRRASHPAIGSDDTWAIENLRGELWFGTFGGGLHRLDVAGRITRFMPVDGDARSLPAATVLSLVADGRGRLWIGTTKGLARWTGRDFERVPLPGNRAAMVFSITPEADGLWIGTDHGLHRLDAGGLWYTPPWSAMFGRPNAVLGMIADGGGRYWLATQRNFWRVKPGEVPYPVPIDTHGPPQPMQTLLRQPGGGLWLPVPGTGLGFLRPDWQRLSQHTRTGGGLSGELYLGIAAAREGGVWLAGNRGELEWLGDDGTVQPAPRNTLRRLERRRPISVFEDREGRLWLGERAALLRIDTDGRVDEWAAQGGRDAPLPGPIELLAQAPDGTIWLSCSGAGLQQRDAESGRVLATIPAGVAHGLGVGDLEALVFDHAGRLWIAGGKGLDRWNARTRRFEPVPGIVRGDRVFAFAFDGDDGLWLQRLGGLERYRRAGARWRRIDVAGPANGLPAVEASGLVLDHAGRVWLATRRGLFRWEPGPRRLRHFGLGDGLSSQEFNDRGLVLTRDGVLHATLADGGVIQLDTLARDPAPRRPTLRFDRLETWSEGRWRPLDAALPVLTPANRELRVRLRLLAFDQPRANRYFTHLAGYDASWVTHTGSDPGERVFANLSPGRYTLRARATDAAGNPAIEQRLHFVVQAPWWRTPWAYIAFAAAALFLAMLAAAAWRASSRRRQAWERAQHEREVAREASLAKTRFLATLGHEVRTPMTGVLGMSELLLDTPLTPRQRDYADAIRGAGEHLLRLVNDALDLARIEAGRLELADEPFDLRMLIDDVARLTGPLARRRGLRFHCDVASQVPRGIRGDAVRVRQILLNLLGNAIKFTERGHVALRVDALPDALRFAISDTGPGLGEAQRERLFRRFEQGLDARTAARYGGSGLGLAICQELAAAMGGCIGVESEPGRGTRFEVDLPLAAALLPESVGGAPVDLPRLRVLLVEDDATVADVVIGLLCAQGHTVTHVGHGLAALAEVATSTFDVALLDLDLPGLDGLALARHLRSLGFDLPLVALTARADAEAEAASMGAGFDRFMRKPVTGAMLAMLLRECCDGTA